MSNSSLANYINRSIGNYEPRAIDEETGFYTIDRITIHCAFQKGDCYDLAELLQASPDSSYHYGISTDGTVGLYVDEMYATYSTGSEANDSRAINIICMTARDNDPAGHISTATYEALVKLCIDICRRNYITEFKYDPGDLENTNLTMHRWFANVDCPGSDIASTYSKLAREVNKALQSAQTAESETEALKSQSTIAVTSIKPYMITPDPDATGINYLEMKNIGVVGAMFCAGSYFDNNHVPKSSYINGNLKQQIAEISSAKMPHALYAIVRARTLAEAKQECKALWLVVSKYPPKLGLWLKLEFGDISSQRAVEVVNTYYKYIVEWGLKSKCGFYCTRAAANKINWPQFTDRFALWWIEDISDVSTLEQLLTPSLFKLK